MKNHLALIGRVAFVGLLVAGALQLAVAPAFANCVLSCYEYCNDHWSDLYGTLLECRQA